MYGLIAAASQISAISRSWERNARNAAAQQDYANLSQAQLSRSCAHNDDGRCPNYCGLNDRCKLDQVRELQRPREMTAADLSLVQCSERNYVIVCPPEMTAGDLGLPDAPMSPSQVNAVIRQMMDNLYLASRPRFLSDAPYSFWLGANA